MSAFAAVTIRAVPGGKSVTARSFKSDGMEYVSLTDFAQAAGFKSIRDEISGRATFENSRGKIAFVKGNPVYIIDTASALLPYPPVVRDNETYLPAPYIAAAFGAKYAGAIGWDAKSSTITIDSSPPRADAPKAASSKPEPPKTEPSKTEPKAAPIPLPIPTGTHAIRTVVIDPGHGGRDPGATGPTGIKEKDIVLAIGLDLRKLLVKAGFTVHMTREKDVFVPLRDRTDFANKKKADLFVSIHANAVEGEKKRLEAVKGYRIYFLSQAEDEADKLSAMRENAVIQFEDMDTRKDYDALQNVLMSILGAEQLRESQDLSIIMEQTFAKAKTGIRRQYLGIGQANFWVLNGAYMPAVLIEIGYISNPAEEKLLSDKRVQGLQAAAIADAIKKFKKQVEGN